MSGKKPFNNDGYQPETHGYKPAQQPRPMDMVHIPAHHEHPFRTNVNTDSGST